MSKILQARAALSTTLSHFVGYQQRQTLLEMLRGEEAEWMAETILDINDTVESMPYTSQTDGQGDGATVYLHYFRGSVDAWITERDMGDEGPTPWLDTKIGPQLQAFGKMCLFGDKEDAEWGYISIEELIENNVELDLYWTPKTMKECMA